MQPFPPAVRLTFTTRRTERRVRPRTSGGQCRHLPDEGSRAMTRTELIRLRRQMHRRIRETVAERRLRVALRPQPEKSPPGEARRTDGG
jgi:hypothetical protein